MPLIVFEGIDGCGKSTQVQRLLERLTHAGTRVRQLREPGGTRLGEQVRALLLDPQTQACPTAELFGYLTARAQLCHEVLRPALQAGEIVVLDRFFHSTLAYQAYGLGVDVHAVRGAIRLATADLRPDLALWFELDPQVAQARRALVRAQDRIEARGLDYLRRVHAGYAALSAAGELIAIDASRTADAIAERVWELVAPVIAQVAGTPGQAST